METERQVERTRKEKKEIHDEERESELDWVITRYSEEVIVRVRDGEKNEDLWTKCDN